MGKNQTPANSEEHDAALRPGTGRQDGPTTIHLQQVTAGQRGQVVQLTVGAPSLDLG